MRGGDDQHRFHPVFQRDWRLLNPAFKNVANMFQFGDEIIGAGFLHNEILMCFVFCQPAYFVTAGLIAELLIQVAINALDAAPFSWRRCDDVLHNPTE